MLTYPRVLHDIRIHFFICLQFFIVMRAVQCYPKHPHTSSFSLIFLDKLHIKDTQEPSSAILQHFHGFQGRVVVSEIATLVPSEAGFLEWGLKDDKPSELRMPKFETDSCWCFGADDDCCNVPGCK